MVKVGYILYEFLSHKLALIWIVESILVPLYDIWICFFRNIDGEDLNDEMETIS